MEITCIIARYNEDLKWTLEFPFNQFNYIVYNKGVNMLFEKKTCNKNNTASQCRERRPCLFIPYHT